MATAGVVSTAGVEIVEKVKAVWKKWARRERERDYIGSIVNRHIS